MKVVFDTNIYVSAFALPGGKAEEAIRKAVGGEIDLLTSAAILMETIRILRLRFDWEEERIVQLLRFLSKTAKVLKTKAILHILKDEPDNRILECAEKGKADYIVTGDRHLISLKHHKDTKILSLADFHTLLK